MNIKLNYLTIAITGLILLACGGEQGSDINQKREELKALKKQMVDLKAQISKLEEELIEQDSAYASERDKSILVATHAINPSTFIHKVNIRGSVASRKNVVLSGEAMAKVTKINVQEGQAVRKGQILIQLDADILRNSIQELETSLDLARTLYNKQKNLWDQNIGTEVQYLQAKNQKESLERRLKTTRSQLDNYYVKAPFDGRVYELDIKVGTMVSPGLPVCRVVSLEDMYIQADVSETYVGKFNVGDSVEINIPAIGMNTYSTISAIGKVINEQNRTFQIEVGLPSSTNGSARANQVTVLTLTDYVKEKAITIPSRIVQKDGEGNYIYIAEKTEEGVISRKKHIDIGKSYNLQTEVINGLNGNEKVLTEGYRDVADGTLISIAG